MAYQQPATLYTDNTGLGFTMGGELLYSITTHYIHGITEYQGMMLICQFGQVIVYDAANDRQRKLIELSKHEMQELKALRSASVQGDKLALLFKECIKFYQLSTSTSSTALSTGTFTCPIIIV